MKKYRNMNFYARLFFVAGIMVCGANTVSAQRMIRVSGTVYNVADKKHVTPVTETEVLVYSCKTIAEAEKLRDELDSGSTTIAVVLNEENVVRIDKNGYYEIIVPDNGALVFKSLMANAVLTKVNNHQRIDVNMDLGLKLDEVLVTGLRMELKPEPTISEFLGDRMALKNTFVLPQQTGSSYSRLIIQPYLVECGDISADTVAYCNPVVIDGEKFHAAQIRKMGYDIGRDSLSRFIDKNISLTSKEMRIEWNDTVMIPDPDMNYSCYADFIIESFNGVDSKRNFQIVSCKNRRPLMFMEYNLVPKNMDFFSDYNRERAQVEKRSTADKINLTFKINSDDLVETDENLNNMNSIKSKLNMILAEEGATLKELYITGYSSPDGNLTTNKALAQKRTNRIMDEVVKILPKSVNDMLYKMPDADVRPWTEVADRMKKDGLSEEAAKIKEIIDEFPDDINRQGMNIKRLGFYNDVVVKYLNSLREVEYAIKYDIYREPTDEEVMDAYKKDGPDGNYTRYEYWKLFQMLDNDKELEKLALKAYRESVEQNPDKPWALAGNIVAVQYLKRDTVDVNLLEPIINRTIYTSNYEVKGTFTNRMEMINPAEVINNQLCMYIKKKDFGNASIMAKMLPDDEEYNMIKAYAWALGGYYKGGNDPEEMERCRKTFETIKNSSPRNKVIMYLALNTEEGNNKAEKAIAELPAGDAVTWYLKAVISARKGDVGMTDTMLNLYQCFMTDRSFLHIARNDGEFTDDVIEGAEDMLMD